MPDAAELMSARFYLAQQLASAVPCDAEWHCLMQIIVAGYNGFNIEEVLSWSRFLILQKYGPTYLPLYYAALTDAFMACALIDTDWRHACEELVNLMGTPEVREFVESAAVEMQARVSRAAGTEHRANHHAPETADAPAS